MKLSGMVEVRLPEYGPHEKAIYQYIPRLRSGIHQKGNHAHAAQHVHYRLDLYRHANAQGDQPGHFFIFSFFSQWIIPCPLSY